MIRRVAHGANWTAAAQLVRGDATRASGLAAPEPPAQESSWLEARVRERTAELEAATDTARAALADAEQADRLKDTFLAMASHELRTPLQATLYWAELLRGQPTPELAAEAARHIIHHVHVQSRLIDDLLDISRFLTGQLHLEWRRTDPVEVVDKAAEVVRAEAAVRGIHIDLQRPDKPVLMTTDPVRLEQVAWNLISNAVHASADRASIQVRMQATDEVFRLEVQDSGVGIQPQELENIFEVFHRSACAAQHGGLGLGLPITRSIVRQFGGRITAASEGAGHGALFTVELPLRGPAEAHELTHATAAQVPGA
jgi:signal transduction histidine kinase